MDFLPSSHWLLAAAGALGILGGFKQYDENKKLNEGLRSAQNKIIDGQEAVLIETADKIFKSITGHDSWVRLTPNFQVIEGGKLKLYLQYFFYGKYPMYDAVLTVKEIDLSDTGEGKTHRLELGTLFRQGNISTNLVDFPTVDIKNGEQVFYYRFSLSSRSSEQNQELVLVVNSDSTAKPKIEFANIIVQQLREFKDYDDKIAMESFYVFLKYYGKTDDFDTSILSQFSGLDKHWDFDSLISPKDKEVIDNPGWEKVLFRK